MDTKNSIDNLNEFMNMSLMYKDKQDFNNALKYASLATISTDYPRADTCCQMGEIYLCKNNLEWAEFWFEKAIGNIYVDIDGNQLDASFSTWIPMLKLSYIKYKKNEIKTANEYIESVLKIVPDNEDAINLKKIYEDNVNKEI